METLFHTVCPYHCRRNYYILPGDSGLTSRRAFLRSILASIFGSIGVLLYLPLRYRARTFEPPREAGVAGDRILLPLPRLDGSVSLERSLANRRSIREYTSSPITLDELSQVLWAAYGITEVRYGFKTTPSAGATYPLEVYAVVDPYGVAFEGGYLEPGSYKYEPHSHSIVLVKGGDLSRSLYEAALEQDWVLEAPVNIVITAVFERTTSRYGERGVRYVWIEVGHAGQNIYLQATSMGLATVAIGAFHDDIVREIIGAPPNEDPLYIMPLARPTRRYILDEDELRRYIASRRG